MFHRTYKSRGVAGVAFVIAACALVPATAAAQSSGDVSGTVTVQQPASPCITIDNTSVAFGTLGFSPSPTSTIFGDANPSTTLTNCSGPSGSGGVTQQLFARGSDATGSGALWNLAATTTPCSAGQDVYGYTVRPNPGTANGTSLTATDVLLSSTWGPGPDAGWLHRIYMPCAGSSGAGQTMSTNVTFTATF